jgi:hypothetical protein
MRGVSRDRLYYGKQWGGKGPRPTMPNKWLDRDDLAEKAYYFGTGKGGRESGKVRKMTSTGTMRWALKLLDLQKATI